MAVSSLFGPVSAEWLQEHLGSPESCLGFDTRSGVGAAPADAAATGSPPAQSTSSLVIHGDDTWESVRARFPAGFEPEVLFLYMQYRSVPRLFWTAPIPIVALAGDPNLQWHAYRQLLPHADLVLTDLPSVERFQKAGIAHVRAMNLYGLGQSWLHSPWPEGNAGGASRDIDVLFVGNFQVAVQRERLPWLARLAFLRPRWNVVISTGIFGAEYRKLLARSRIVFNRSIRGECNGRAAEAIAAGALLFQEEGNREVQGLLKDRTECIYYREDNLLELMRYYLEHEDERGHIAASARRRMSEFSFRYEWDCQRARIESELPALRERAQDRHKQGRSPDLGTRVWVHLSNIGEPDSTLASDLRQEIQESPRDAAVLNAAGVFAGQVRPGQEPFDAAHAFQEAWRSDPHHLMAGLNLAEMLHILRQPENVEVQARRTLEMLDQQELAQASFLDAPHAPPGFDEFRMEWERAAWRHVGQQEEETRSKIALLRWRLHTLLAQAQGDLGHAFMAASLRPDSPSTLAWLGCALARQDRMQEASYYLRQAHGLNPFDVDIAAALAESWKRLGWRARLEQLMQERRLLSAAAPRLVPAEPWFAERIPPGPPQSGRAELPLRLVWTGSQQALHSLALVNRELCKRLLERGHELSLLPARQPDPPGTPVPLPESLQSAWNKSLSGAPQVQIAHQWPPDFTAPREGHWIVLQPWEFGSLPCAWLEPMRQQIDEVWVPSHFVRDGYIQSGLDPERVHVIPNGVSSVFLQDAIKPLELPTTKRFKFLFVGGTIERKGIDLLLRAYGHAFSDKDDVCLVIKDMGVGTFYQGQTAEKRIEQFRQAPDAPAIVYLSRELSEVEMASLYAACNSLVHPYRGEGFGLPIAEAMGVGLPVIVTGYGAALDFCREEHAYLIAARLERFRSAQVGDLPTVDRPYWAEPDGDHLRLLLRHVVEHEEEAREKGRRARQFIGAHFTWDHAIAALEARLQEILQRPLRRSLQTSSQRLVPATAHSALFRCDLPAAGTIRHYEPEKRPMPASQLPSPDVNLGVSARSDRHRHQRVDRPHVSLTMIVRNEEHNLSACLETVADLVDEIVIIDTGSTDRTKEIAARFGARIYDFPWIDSFSAARNQGLLHARGAWIFWMDADDRLDAVNREKLRALLASLPEENLAYVMNCLCVSAPVSDDGTEVKHVRLFRNHPGLRWTFRIHEQILPSIRNLGGDVEWSGVTIHHVGYQDPAVRQRKLQRDLRLLTLEYQDQPDNPFTLFNLASVYQEQGRTAEALDFFQRSLERSAPSDSIVRKLYASIAQCQRQLGKSQEALKTCIEGRAHYPLDVEILTQEALARRAIGDRKGAIECLEAILVEPEGQHFGSVDTGLRGYKTRHNLAVLLQEDGRLKDAESQWQAVLQEHPDYLPALAGLADLKVEEKEWTGLEAILNRLRGTGKGELEALTLQARRHLVMREFYLAHKNLDQATALNPIAVWPRLLRARVYLQEGNWQNAEQALRDVLLLDPDHSEAKNNLEVLLRQQGRFKEER